MVNRQMNNLISIDSFVSVSNVRVSFDHSPPPSPTTPAAFPTSSLPRRGPHNRLPSPLMTERRRMSPRLGNVYWRNRCLNLAPIHLFWRLLAICVCLFLPRLFTEPESYGCACVSTLTLQLFALLCEEQSPCCDFFFPTPQSPLCSGRVEEAWQTGGGWIERSRTNKGEGGASRWVMLGWEEEEGGERRGDGKWQKKIREKVRNKRLSQGLKDSMQSRIGDWMNDSSCRKILRNKTEECKHETEKGPRCSRRITASNKTTCFFQGKIKHITASVWLNYE